MTPMTAVASTHAGYAKPLGYLILAGVVLLAALWWALASEEAVIFVIGLVIAIIFLVVYALEKRMALFVETSGGTMFGLVFKRSVIEGVDVDIEKVRAIVNIVRDLVIAAQTKTI